MEADAQEEHTLDAADAQEEPALDLNQSEENEATADAHMVGSRRSTLLYGDRNEREMIEGRPVYESTKVSEALADASGGSGTEGGDSGERLHCKFGEVVADDMQSKPSSGFIAKFEKEVSSSAGEVSNVAQDDALHAILARVAAALRAELLSPGATILFAHPVISELKISACSSAGLRCARHVRGWPEA